MKPQLRNQPRKNRQPNSKRVPGSCDLAYTTQILLGQISKVYGYEGFVVVRFEKRFIGDYFEQESVFLEIEGKPVPFFIEDQEYAGGDIVRMKFEGWDTDTKIGEFVGCKVYLTEDDGSGKETADITMLKDYSVSTKKGVILGAVKEIIDNTSQYLLVVISPKGKEILVPLHEDLIEEINEEKKMLVVDLPEDIISVND